MTSQDNLQYMVECGFALILSLSAIGYGDVGLRAKGRRKFVQLTTAVVLVVLYVLLALSANGDAMIAGTMLGTGMYMLIKRAALRMSMPSDSDVPPP